jgi:hypothetical protein
MEQTDTYLDQLTDYIKRNLKKGYTKDSLRWALIEQGNSRMEVEKAFLRVDKELAREAPILQTKPIIKYEVVEPKDYPAGESLSDKISNFFKSLF